MRIASPERRWRAVAAPVLAGLVGWFLAGSVRLRTRTGAAPWTVPLTARIVVACLAVAVGLWLAVLIMRTHLLVSDTGPVDYRVFRIVRLPWELITGFEVGRPRALWGGCCVIAVCRDGTTVDLMSTRAYSRVPSARHLDELHRICWSLDERAAMRTG